MTRHLTIESDEAYDLAHSLAEREGASVTEVVERALRQLNHRLKPSVRVTPEEAEACYRAIKTLAEEAARDRGTSMGSDHSDLYDEYGLPK